MTRPASSGLIMAIVLLATLTRVAIPPMIGHLPNFSPIDAIALFCGAHISKRSTAILITLLSVWVGDVLINSFFIGELTLVYDGFYWQYLSYVLIALVGRRLQNNTNMLPISLACFASAMLFFTISNFGVWYSGLLYPLTLDGLIQCYIAAIPFLQNTLISDLVFTGMLFGLYNIVVPQRSMMPSSRE